VYRVTAGTKRVIGGIVFLIIGIVLVAAGLAVMSQSSDSPFGGIFLAAFGVCFVMGAIYYFLYGTIYKNWCVYVLEHGFLFKKGNEAVQPFRWDQIEAVWYQVTRHYRNGIYTGTTHRYKVRRRDGYEIV